MQRIRDNVAVKGDELHDVGLDAANVIAHRGKQRGLVAVGKGGLEPEIARQRPGSQDKAIRADLNEAFEDPSAGQQFVFDLRVGILGDDGVDGEERKRLDNNEQAEKEEKDASLMAPESRHQRYPPPGDAGTRCGLHSGFSVIRELEFDLACWPRPARARPRVFPWIPRFLS